MDVLPDSSGLESLLSRLQRVTFDYFLNNANPRNGLIADRTRVGSPASIAATGFALGAYPIGVARGFISRADAAARTLATLRFFWTAPHGPEPDATGYKGFYYHFLDMRNGRRAWKCELSTVDTALLLAGVLAAGAFFREDDEAEAEIRRLADALYRRTDWRWAQNGGAMVTHGWRPEKGFLRYHWQGYDEALILYILGLGSPTFPLPPESYRAWLSGFRWKKIYGREFLYAGPLFVHQFSHAWIDFRGIRDDFMRSRGSDYFENSRTATYIQREYAIRNPRHFAGYGEHCWGISASDGPGPMKWNFRGRVQRFAGYLARGVPYGPDDGTLSPSAAIASLPFAPEIVLPAVASFRALGVQRGNPSSFISSFNLSAPDPNGGEHGWVAPEEIGISQGAMALMIENYRSGLLWRLMRSCPYIVQGLRRAGFCGGWL